MRPSFARACVTALLLVSPLAAVGACSGGGHDPLAGGSDFVGLASPEAGPCVDGTTQPCGITLGKHDGVVDCLQATQVCHGGVWGECGEQGPVTTKSMSLPEDGDPTSGPTLSTKGLGAPGPCTTNPCDPYCQTFNDTTDGGLALDGLVYADADAGGITIPITPPTDGGGSDALSSSFGTKANIGGGCTKNSDCNVDQTCVIPPGATTGTCQSWSSGAFNAACQQAATTYGALTPKPTCQTNDPDGYNDYNGSVSVGQFDPTFSAPALFVGVASPSSSGTTITQEAGGKLKFFDAMNNPSTCNLRLVIPTTTNTTPDPDGFGSQATRFAEDSEPLVVDLNGDGVPEVVQWDRNAPSVSWSSTTGALYTQRRLLAYSITASGSSTTIAYTATPYAGWRDPAGVVGRAWQSTKVGSGWLAGTYAALVPLWADGGLGALDLDGDGKPEIVTQSGFVFNPSGQLIALPPAPPSGYSYYDVVEQYQAGPILGNLDGDTNVEFVHRQGIYEFVPGSGWTPNAGSTWPSAAPKAWDWSNPQFSALADFGAYGANAGAPEIARVAAGRIFVVASDGSPVFGFSSPVYVPGGGGGPVNIGDFDGDGLPEIGVAGGAYYSVFDIDCVSPRSYAGKTGTCTRSTTSFDCLSAGDCTPPSGQSYPVGVLWSRRTQDQSSAVTGSTVFDFNADGKAEVVYADECWTRVYDGTTGGVIYSTQHSSGTILEQPIVADVNLDGRAELLVSNERGLETTPGEGMFCPSRVVFQAPLQIDWNSGSLWYQTNVSIARTGGNVTVRWADGGGEACLVGPGGAPTRCAWSSSSPNGVTNWAATIALQAGDPTGTWTLEIYPSSNPIYWGEDVWLQGFPLVGSTSPVTVAGATNGKGTDSFFAGLSCNAASDCPTTGMSCDTTNHLCRCTSDAQCGTGFQCIDSVGGRACRPTRSYGTNSGVTGVQVWGGPGAGWAMSRYVWNEHAYQPANVQDNASVKKTATCDADEAAAWTPAAPSANSYREQTQYPGSPASGLPDLTMPYPCNSQSPQVCNRGAGTSPPGAMVVWFPGNSTNFSYDTSQSNPTVCYTTQPIQPGQCITLNCPHNGTTGEWVVNPTCHGNKCATDADCKGGQGGQNSTGTCNTTTGFCNVTGCNAKVPYTNVVQECTNNSGNWAFNQSNTGSACGGPASVPPSATFQRVFQAGTCPSGTHVQWGLFSYSTSDPTGTDVVFSFQTGPDTTTASTAPSVTVATAGYAPIGSTTTSGPQTCQVPTDSLGSVTCPIALATAITPNNDAVLIMTATLNANTATVTAPTLLSWNVTYDCVPSE